MYNDDIGMQKNESRREYALRKLKELIISCEIEPGAFVTEQDLADQFGISRTPIREALVELSKTKILTILPQKGCRISLIDYAIIRESIFVRTVLETAIIDVICERITDEDFMLLDKSIMLQNYYLEKHMSLQLYECDNEFHMLLYQIANMMQTYALVSNMTIHFNRLRSLGLSSIKTIKIVGDHMELLDALKNKDTELAKQIIVDHIGTRSLLNEPEIRQKHPTYFLN